MIRIPYDVRERYVYAPLGLQTVAPNGVRFEKQEQILHCLDDSVRYVTIVGGVNAAKSFTSAMYVLPEIVLAQVVRNLNGWKHPGEPGFEPLNCWIVGDNYLQPRKEFSYIYDAIRNTPALMDLTGGFVDEPSMPEQGMWTMRLRNGVVVSARSWGNPESLHTEPVYIMLLVEVGLLSEWLYQNRILARLGKIGGLCVSNGTLEHNGDVLTDLLMKGKSTTGSHRSFTVASWENPFAYNGGADDPTILEMRNEMTPETFAERFGATPKKSTGLVHGLFDHARNVGDFPLDTTQKIDLWIDPGANGYWVGVVQYRRVLDLDIAYLIDEYFEPHIGTTEKAIDWLLQHPEYANRVRYAVNDHRQPEQGQIWSGGAIWYINNETQARGLYVRSKHVPIAAGVDRVNSLLFQAMYGEALKTYDKYLVEAEKQMGLVRLYIDRRCTRVIWEMSKGYKYPDSLDGHMRNEPVDRNNHACKGIAYGCVDHFGFIRALNVPPQRAKVPPLAGLARFPVPLARRAPRVTDPAYANVLGRHLPGLRTPGGR